MKNKILSAISAETNYSYDTIEKVYNETKSYDVTIELCNVCSLCNVEFSEVLSILKLYADYINKLTTAGLSGAEAAGKLREVLKEINEKQ